MQRHHASEILHVDIQCNCKVKYMTLIYPKALWNEMDEETLLNT